jgi:transcriptional regulator with XRE-family HTH domain
MKMAGQIQNDPSDQIWTVEIRKAKGYLGSDLARRMGIGRRLAIGGGEDAGGGRGWRRRPRARRQIAGVERIRRSRGLNSTRASLGERGGCGEPFPGVLVDGGGAGAAGDGEGRRLSGGEVLELELVHSGDLVARGGVEGVSGGSRPLFIARGGGVLACAPSGLRRRRDRVGFGAGRAGPRDSRARRRRPVRIRRGRSG